MTTKELINCTCFIKYFNRLHCNVDEMFITRISVKLFQTGADIPAGKKAEIYSLVIK